jgi:hypothetical protein
MNIQVEVFRVMTPCSDAIAWRRFGGPQADGELVGEDRKIIFCRSNSKVGVRDSLTLRE